jgi:hypothetical protein
VGGWDNVLEGGEGGEGGNVDSVDSNDWGLNNVKTTARRRQILNSTRQEHEIETKIKTKAEGDVQ